MFKNIVEANYLVREVDAGALDKVKELAKKAGKLLIPVVLSLLGSTLAHGQTLSGEQAKKLDHQVQTILKTNHVDTIKFFTKVTEQNGITKISFTYTSADGSHAGVRIVETASGNFSVEKGETKNKEGYVDRTIEQLNDGLYDKIQELAQKDFGK